MGARAASSHTGALAGNDKIYEDVFKSSRASFAPQLARSARIAGAFRSWPTPKGNNVVIITGAGGSACSYRTHAWITACH